MYSRKGMNPNDAPPEWAILGTLAMVIAVLCALLFTLSVNADVVRLDVPRSLDGERVLAVGVDVRSSGKPGLLLVSTNPDTSGAISAVGNRVAQNDELIAAATLYAPRLISADALKEMVWINGTWHETPPECYRGVLPIQPRPDEPLRTGGPTPDFQGCHGCGFKGVRR